jgi:ribonucleoside-diphosphate reductase subunit M1
LASENKKFTPAAVIQTPAFKADVPEGDSPKSLATEPATAPLKEEQLPEPANPVKAQEEDVKGESDGREQDIYAEAALQCKVLPF